MNDVSLFQVPVQHVAVNGVDIAFRRALLEQCLMFKEDTITLKALDGTAVSIPSVVQNKIPVVFVYSKSGNLIKSKLSVDCL